LLDALKPHFDTVYAMNLVHIVGMHVRQLCFYGSHAHFAVLHVLGGAVNLRPYVLTGCEFCNFS
jgi:hypothetical protein